MIINNEIKKRLEELIKMEDLNPLQQAILRRDAELFWYLVWHPGVASYWFRPVKVQRIVKRRMIIELIGTGKKIREIADMLDTSDVYVRQVVKEYRKTKQKEKNFANS